MGIPSYYKKLIDTISGLVNKGHPSDDIQWLFMDFNCLIYHCLHRNDIPEYSESNKDEWETILLNSIVNYTLKVIKEVNPKKGVFIAIDGVVPMAKMRQQRLRRFKSIWLTQNTDNKVENTEVWDKNSITPGTLFMTKLKNVLETMIKKNGKKTWILSSSDEPGEGEHKIIAEWRKGTYSGDFAVYGLDADLIILTILGREYCNLNNNVWLFREEVNQGKLSYDSNGEEIFEWFSVNTLKNWLSSEFAKDPEKQRAFILNYCFAMTILGNDFLPSSLGLKIRDDGHSELLDIIKNLTDKNITLVNPFTFELSFNDIKTLFTILATDEEHRITKFINKKLNMAKNLGLNETLPIGENNWPLSHIEESILISNKQLNTNWKELYLTNYFNGFNYTKYNIDKLCKEYLYGMQWVWSYYLGAMDNVCFNWVYSFNLPPLWEWIRDYLIDQKQLPSFPEKILVKAEDIKPVEQLALVLPLESWSLIPHCQERSLPKWAPQFYPSVFSFDSVGKRFFWECESMIPLPTILEVKEIIKHYT